MSALSLLSILYSAYYGIDMNPLLLFPRSGSEFYLHFLSSGSGRKGKETRNFVLSHLVPIVGTGMKGTMEPGEFRNNCCACCAW